MNADETTHSTARQIDASCRLPLLALFGGAALWLVAGLAMSLAAIMTFHKPDIFADCPALTYGRAQAAANDLLVYGFCVPAALGVMLWIFARLGETELVLPLLPFAAANIWHLGVFIGVAAILIGDSTGFAWLEFPRGGSVLLFTAYLLAAISAAATFGARRRRELYPSHWFLLAALLWFPWIYSTANLLLAVHHPVRGVAQAVIDWWFSNNFIFVWLALVGIGVAFYLLPKLSGRPLQGRYTALFVFWALILFGTWLGIPQGAPVPAWLPASSALAALLLLLPLIVIGLIATKTLAGPVSSGQTPQPCKGGPLCHAKFGTAAFILSGLMLIALSCPHFSRIVGFTWFGPAQIQLQILGFFTVMMYGAIYYLLPGVMESPLPFPGFVRVQHWLFMLGITLWVGALAVGGLEQGMKLGDPAVSFADSTQVALMALRVGTTGLALLLLGALLFSANIFAMTLKWMLGLGKSGLALVQAPLETAEVKS
jgi:cytochrome c oxidase cbb3-type subunit 1